MRDCVPCQGVGIVAQKVNQKVFRYTCRACRGTGEVPDTECGECESRGKVTRVIEDVVKLEPNSRPEKKFIFSNKGGQGLNGGPRGNLIIWLDVSFPNVEDLTDEDKEHLKRICQKS
jgi:molecular chaperone DnaJ